MMADASFNFVPRRVLIVEGDPLAQTGMRAQLEKLRHAVVASASTSAEALRLFRETQPEIVLLEARINGTDGIELAAQLLAYPVTDVAGNYADAKENARFPSRAENAEGYFLSRAVMEWFAGHYLGDAGQGTDWRVSPLRAKKLAGLAPAIICTAWFDPLRDEGKAYADALAAAGVATKYYHGAGLIHGYFGLGEASQTARLEAQRARADFKAMLERGV